MDSCNVAPANAAAVYAAAAAATSLHIPQVLPASEAQLLDQQRLKLQLNHKGIVLSVNPGASKSVFGFHPQDLVGRPLAAFVNLFSQWRGKFGEDESLLVMLGMRAEQGLDVIYRCGVHSPFNDAELAHGAGASTAAGGLGSTMGGTTGSTNLLGSMPGGGGSTAAGGLEHSLLGALKLRHKERPAVLTMSVVHASDEAEGSTTAAGAASGAAAAALDPNATAVLAVSLWRAEGLTSLMEVDGKLGISRAEPAAGLMFGVAHGQLLRKSFRRCAVCDAGGRGAAATAAAAAATWAATAVLRSRPLLLSPG
jgi:hypothetical protein